MLQCSSCILKSFTLWHDIATCIRGCFDTHWSLCSAIWTSCITGGWCGGRPKERKSHRLHQRKHVFFSYLCCIYVELYEVNNRINEIWPQISYPVCMPCCGHNLFILFLCTNNVWSVSAWQFYHLCYLRGSITNRLVK